MRTPLNGIIGMTYLVEQADIPAEVRQNLEKIDTSSRFLLNLLNDLLDMTKAESGKITLHTEPYPKEEFCAYVDAVIRPLCESKNQQLTAEVIIPDGCVPKFDKLRINQIVFNLLSNAVKYTPEGGRIQYRAEAELLENGRLGMHIRVEDNGIGISEDFQRVLFDPFTQENRNDNSAQRGVGLGLAITKQLVELMNGTITVKSSMGKGSTFLVDMEVDCGKADEAAEKQVLPETEEQTAQLAGRHVLLCEDHPLNQEIAKALLEAKGITVELADDGERGVQAFGRSSVGYYDAILMDIRMPVMNGYEATEKIRALNRADAKTVPIIAMTADAFAEDVKKCLDRGMNGHIAKPIDPEAMYGMLAQAMKKNGR